MSFVISVPERAALVRMVQPGGTDYETIKATMVKAGVAPSMVFKIIHVMKAKCLIVQVDKNVLDVTALGRAATSCPAINGEIKITSTEEKALKFIARTIEDSIDKFPAATPDLIAARFGRVEDLDKAERFVMGRMQAAFERLARKGFIRWAFIGRNDSEVDRNGYILTEFGKTFLDYITGRMGSDRG